MGKRQIASALIASVAILLVVASCSTSAPPPSISDNEVEATEFMGHSLTPIRYQNNNALAGTQHIDKDTYRLIVDGLVDHPLTLSYADLQGYPQISQLMDLDCVEGWNFTAKWTEPALKDIFNKAGINPEAKIAIFHTKREVDALSTYISQGIYLSSTDRIVYQIGSQWDGK